MSIQWRVGDKTYDMFPIKCTTNNKMFMTPIYKEGSNAFAFPGNGHDIHILQISHRDLNVSASGDRPWPMSGNNASYTAHHIAMCTSGDCVTGVDMFSPVILNPYYFKDIGRTDVSGFKSYTYSWSSTNAWPSSGEDGLWDWSARKPRRNGTIYRGPSWDGEERNGAAWGFVIALDRSDLWPNPEAILTFGTIFAVPQKNDRHSITIYFKGGTKGNLEKTTGTKWGTNIVRNIMKYTTSNFHYPLCAFVTDDKLREGVPANWQKNTMNYYETTYATDKLSPYRSHKDIQLIGEDADYKYILAKGRTAITKDTCHIFTPPTVVYSGNISNTPYSPTMLDAWVSIIPSTNYGS